MSHANKRGQLEPVNEDESGKNVEMSPLTSTDDVTGRNCPVRKSDMSEVGYNSPVQVYVSSLANCSETSPTSSPQPSPKQHVKYREGKSYQSLPTSTTRDSGGDRYLDLDSTSTSCHGNEDTISRSSESVKSIDLQRSPDSGSSKDLSKEKKGGDKKKKTSSWYNVLNPTYKSKSDDFKRIFKDLPEHERLIVDYSCALQKDILVHGRLYISQNYICFYANIFRWETMLVLKCKEVTAMTKEKTARVIPNAIQVCTEAEKHFFTSFGARDKTYLMLFRVWQNALMEQPMSIQELWQWVHYSYGDELGLTSDDDDYVAPPPIAEEDGKGGNANNGLSLLLLDSKEFGKGLKTPGELSAESYSFKSNCKESPSQSSLGDGQILANGCERGDAETAFTTSATDKISVEGALPSSSLSNITLSDPRIPTDLSDSTESENEILIHVGEVHCPCESHFGKECLNFVYPMAVEQVFTMLFCDSKFFADFQRSRKTTDLVQSQWQENRETGNKHRQITYTLTLGMSMGPKTAQTSETQTMLKGSKSGTVYVIEVEAVNMGIPYCDTFFTSHRYCLTQVTPTECRVRVHSQIKYRKSVWGLVKTFIEKNVLQGVEEYFKDLEMALQREYARLNQQKPAKTRRRRRLLKPDSSKSEAVVDGIGKHSYSGAQRRVSLEIGRLLVGGPDFLVKIVLFVLVLLLFLNALLYYKLWSLETQTNKRLVPSTYIDIEILRNIPRTGDEWARLVKQQETLHQIELEKWTEVLKTSVQLLQQTEDSLINLQKGIRPYQMQRILQLFGEDHLKESATVTPENEGSTEAS